MYHFKLWAKFVNVNLINPDVTLYFLKNSLYRISQQAVAGRCPYPLLLNRYISSRKCSNEKERISMAKGQDARKNVKQKPEKTLKEKRKEKKAKKAKA